ncbi:hypothetical protein DID78_02495 [Candidatus Marinamargulisbacteria bacterium SCGC AG-343-D04]|nr:hypothetical protein DID78_02495 [Candidatus Marinamargulisbacteria bacterium SCGC AG-343-D04]
MFSKKNILTFILTLCILASFALFLYLSPPSSSSVYKDDPTTTFKGDTPITLTTIHGENIAISDLKNKVLLVNFWATWCPPCRVEIPELIQLKESLADQNFEILGISADDDHDIVLQFSKSASFNYPIVMLDHFLYNTFGPATSIPTSILVDKNFTIKRVFRGYRSSEEIRPSILQLLNRDS